MFAPRMILAVTVLAMGCGGDDPGTPPDAAIDAPPDAPPPLVGLGQKCNAQGDGSDCAAGSGCLSFQTPSGPTGGMCTPICVTNGSFMTDGNKTIVSASPPDPSVNNSVCTSAYTGTVGTPACDVAGMVNRMPTGPLQADTTYTFLIACMIRCSADNMCPSGFMCDTSVASFPKCIPL
jgi:hypothetical protein